MPNANTQAVATVNGQVISQAEFDARYQQVVHSMALNPDTLSNAGTVSLSDVFKRLSLEALITDALIKQFAQKNNIQVYPLEVEKRYQQAQNAHGPFSQTSTSAAFEEKLAKLGYTKDTYKLTLEKLLLKEKVAAYLAKQSGKTIQPSDAAIMAYYQSHHALYDSPEMIHVKHILIEASMDEAEKTYRRQNPNASEMRVITAVNDILSAQRAQAQQILKQLLSQPQKFDALARQYSSDSFSAQDGGDLGYVSRDMMPAAFSTPLFSAASNTIYPQVIQTEFGFHIAKVLDKKRAVAANFASIKAKIAEKLHDDTVEDVIKRWVTQQRASNKIIYSDGYQYEQELHQYQRSLEEMQAQKEKQLDGKMTSQPLLLDVDKD